LAAGAINTILWGRDLKTLILGAPRRIGEGRPRPRTDTVGDAASIPHEPEASATAIAHEANGRQQPSDRVGRRLPSFAPFAALVRGEAILTRCVEAPRLGD